MTIPTYFKLFIYCRLPISKLSLRIGNNNGLNFTKGVAMQLSLLIITKEVFLNFYLANQFLKCNTKIIHLILYPPNPRHDKF